jgi:hypothetical protein
MNLLFCLIPIFLAAVNLSAETASDFKTDAILNGWIQMLPSGWTIKQEGDLLRIKRATPVFILFENKINAPVDQETPAEEKERIRKYGKLENPQIVYRLTPRESPPNGTLSSRYEVTLSEILGITDDFHSVEDPEVSQEVWKLQQTLESTLSHTVAEASGLKSWTDSRVTVYARKAKLMNQFRTSNPKGYPYSEYIEIGKSQTVVYSRKPLPGNGPWEITGRVSVLETEAPDPGRKESVREVHLVAEEVR